MTKLFSVLHLNVRSLNQNFESLKELQTTNKFDFKSICLTEIWCKGDPTLFNLENYISIKQVRKHGRGDGICVFIHNSLTFKLRSDLGTSRNDVTCHRDKKIKYIINQLVNYIINQPAGDFKQNETYLENFFDKMKNSNKAIYTVDDTNLNLIDYETNIKVKNCLNFLFQKNYSHHK